MLILSFVNLYFRQICGQAFYLSRVSPFGSSFEGSRFGLADGDRFHGGPFS
jgi:hypothetical protein